MNWKCVSLNMANLETICRPLGFLYVLLVCLVCTPCNVSCQALLRFSATTNSLSVIVNADLPADAIEINLVLNSEISRLISSFPDVGQELYLFRGLEPGSRYQIQAVFRGTLGEVVTGVDYFHYTRPLAVTDIRALKLDSTKLMTTWASVGGKVDFYEVALFSSAGSIVYEGTGDSRLGFVFPIILDPAEFYNISITSVAHIYTAQRFLPLGKPFSEFEPVKGKLTPDFGHKDGGTSIALQFPALPYLGYGTYIKLRHNASNAQFTCLDNRRVNETQTCVTPSVAAVVSDGLELVDQPLEVQLETSLLSNPYPYVINVDGAHFAYRGDTEIQSVHPMDAVISGGVTLTVKGDNLDLLTGPMMSLTVDCPSGENLTFINLCKVEDRSTMLCPTSDLESRLRNMSCGLAPEDAPVTAVLGLESNNQGLLPLPGILELRVHRCPSLRPFEGDVVPFRPMWHYNERHIDIQGKGFSVLPRALYKVVLGRNGLCEILDVTDSRMRCRPPQEQPTNAKSTHKGVIVQLVVGEKGCVQVAGYLDYWGLFDGIVVQCLVGAGAGIVALALLICMLCRLCKERKAVEKARKDSTTVRSYHPDGTPDYSRSPSGGASDSSYGSFCCCSSTTKNEKYIHDKDPNYDSEPNAYGRQPKQNDYLQPVSIASH